MNICVARQPIFDRTKRLYGYELLFRGPLERALEEGGGDAATVSVLTHGFLLIGVDTLTHGRPAFINLTRRLLVEDVITVFPPDLVVVEILEDIEPDREVLQACQRLKKGGYILALDDFTDRASMGPLVELADIIKVDFQATPPEERRRLIRVYGGPQRAFLAEKVETQEQCQEALQEGYTYIQGFFFSRPHLVTGQDIPAYRLHFLNTLYELQQPDVSFDMLADLILRDLSLSYKILQFVNSAYFGLRHRVRSVRQALVLLGLEEVRKWATLLALTGIGQDKPAELAVHAAVRGKFCEFLGVGAGMRERATDLYLTGLLSLLDGFLDRPLAEIVADLPLHEDVLAALTEQTGPLAPVYRLALAYERANWRRTEEWATQVGLSTRDLPEFYYQAVRWADGVFYYTPSPDHALRPEPR